MSEMACIGILGGMGPVSTAEFYRAIITFCQSAYRISRQDDYPRIVLLSLPIPDDVNFATEPTIVSAILEGIYTLTSAQVDLIAVPCNAAHLLFDQMQNSTQVPIVHIVNATCERVARDGHRSVGVVAAAPSLKHGLYTRALHKFGITSIMPTVNDSELLEAVLVRAAGAVPIPGDRDVIKDLVERLERDFGATAVILGCTELPLIVEMNDFRIPAYDSLQIYAEATVNLAARIHTTARI